MYACMYDIVCMYACMYYGPMCICMYVCLYIQVSMPVCICMYKSMHVCMYVFMYVLCAYVCMYVYIMFVFTDGGFCSGGFFSGGFVQGFLSRLSYTQTRADNGEGCWKKVFFAYFLFGRPIIKKEWSAFYKQPQRQILGRVSVHRCARGHGQT